MNSEKNPLAFVIASNPKEYLENVNTSDLIETLGYLTYLEKTKNTSDFLERNINFLKEYIESRKYND